MQKASPNQLASPSPDKLQGFIASLPGMACQIELQEDGHFTFPYVSEGCQPLLGISASDLQTDAAHFLALIHTEDIQPLLDSMKTSAQTHCFWNWEGRISLPDGETKWISLGATPQDTQGGAPRWEGIVLNTTQSKLGELEVKRVQQQLLELSSHIQDAKEQERLRIAREVHDEIGSLLTAMRMDLLWLIQRLPKDSPMLTEKAKTIEELVNRAITSASHLAHRLRPGFLDCFGIIAAIEIEAQEFSKRSGIPCTIIKSQESIDLPETYSITLFRVCQETLNNILKHARASHVQIEIVKGADHLELIVSDDGIGFSEAARDKPHSFGLRGIHERVAHLGGTVKIASTLGLGTQIAVFVPLPEETPQQALFGGGIDMIDILVVDDHALIRKGLIMLLEENPEFHIKGEAETGMQAINMAREQKFDLVLLDISLSDKHGIDVLKQLKSEQPDIKIIVLSMYPEDQYGLRALKAGAMGYINKQSAPEKLVGAIHQVVGGKKYISPALAEQLLSNLIGESQEQLHQSLSNREYQTLCLMASGKSLTEISEIMVVSPKTVSVYRARMLEKMGFNNNAEAVHYAIAHDLVEAKK